MKLFSLALALFLLMDSFGNIPIFLAILKKLPPKRQKMIIIRELILALIAIVAFYFIGEQLLKLLNISHQAVQIAGGIILFIIAIKLIFPNGKNGFQMSAEKEPFLVPLAIPLIAGPAVLATVMLYSHQNLSPWIVLGAILIAWVASTIVLLFSMSLKKLLGQRGISACEKLMGLILVMIAVQMFVDGIKACMIP